ncbi:hypothetical protein [Actinomadura sp. 3N508]|uniref:hypothetical protein n=1 Tax=Actinomadura sp. 3N508 TaxID=3375153 RepID=UPI003788DAFC
MRIRVDTGHIGLCSMALALAALLGAALVGNAAPTRAAPATAASETASRGEGETSAVEDGAYPDADRIQTERGITVISGNGLITLAECGADSLIQVRSNTKGLVCFDVELWPDYEGVITVKIPEVYYIKGDDHQVTADLTTGKGETKTYPIARDEWTPVGEGADPDNGPETLIELRAK